MEDEPPAFTPPGRGPGLSIPEDLGPRQPGPEFEPGVPPGGPPPVHGETPPSAGYESPAAGNGMAPPPVTGEIAPPGYGAPPLPGHAGTGAVSPAPQEEIRGEALDVFLSSPEGAASNAGDAADAGASPAEAPGEASTGSAPPATEPAPWALTSGPALPPAGQQAAAGAATFSGELVFAGPAEAPGEVTGGADTDLAALVASLRSAVGATAGAFSEPGQRDPGDHNILERLVEMVRTALFMSDDRPSDEALEAQLAVLPPEALAELERYAREHAMDAQDADDADDALEADG